MPIRNYSGAGNYSAPEPTQDTAVKRLAKDDASNAQTDPYANPTGFVSFQQQYDANAGTAQRAAGHLAGKIGGEAKSATDLENANYDAYAGKVASGTDAGLKNGPDAPVRRGAYTGPTDPYAVSGAAQDAANNATRDAKRAGSTGGTQALMGPGTSMFGAALAHHALALQQHALATQAQGAQSMLAGEAAKGAKLADSSLQRVQASQAQYDRDYNSPDNTEARANGFQNFDQMLQHGYDEMILAGNAKWDNFEDYKKDYLAQRAAQQGAMAGDPYDDPAMRQRQASMSAKTGPNGEQVSYDGSGNRGYTDAHGQWHYL